MIPNSKETFIDVLRHGEVLGGSYYRGITDDALTERGWQQMQQRSDTIETWDVIVSSPLQRCLKFATHLSQQRQLPLRIEVGFQEINFGDWEAKTALEIETQQLGDLMKFYQDPINNTPPNAEPILEFQQRVLKSWQELLKQQQGKRILIITHSGVIRALFSLVLDIPLKNSFAIQVNHAGLSRFQCFHGNPNFIQLNDHLS
ncbi:MAG: histidine phosphatase family protein [Methylococcales bacterium]|nr:histidine phosphatase family protein [Methylococcales bacterium]